MGQLTIKDRAKRKTLKLGLKFLSKENDKFFYDLIWDNAGNFTYFGGLLNIILSSTGQRINQIIKSNTSEIGKIPSNLHINNFSFQDKNIPSSTIVMLFEELAEIEWKEHLIIATDASKSENAAGIGIFVPKFNNKARIDCNKVNSIFTLEALGIYFSLLCVKFYNIKKVLILTDSKSALMALKHINIQSNEVIKNIYGELRKLKDEFYEIDLIWSPGHSGILPNETADIIAKDTSLKTANYNLYSRMDLLKYYDSLLARWSEENWKCEKYFPKFKYLKFNLCNNIKIRNKEIKSYAIRSINKSFITRNLISKWKNMSPNCELCNEKEDMEHIFIHCKKFDNIRQLIVEEFSLQNINKSLNDWLTKLIEDKHLELFFCTCFPTFKEFL